MLSLENTHIYIYKDIGYAIIVSAFKLPGDALWRNKIKSSPPGE